LIDWEVREMLNRQFQNLASWPDWLKMLFLAAFTSFSMTVAVLIVILVVDLVF
jgi:hypothetical protein